MTATDVAFLRELHHRAYREVVTRQFGAWNDEDQDRWFEKGLSDGEYQIVEVDGRPVGAIATTEHAGYLELVELQILPDWQGRGIGSALVRAQMDRARAAGKSLRLRALRENRALELYARNGFVVISKTETHVFMEWAESVAPH